MLQNKYWTSGRNSVGVLSHVRLSARRRKQAGRVAQPCATGASGEEAVADNSGMAPDLQGAARAFTEIAVQIKSGAATPTSQKLRHASPARLPISGGLTARRTDRTQA